MDRIPLLIAAAFLALGITALPAQAILMSGPDIISAPGSVVDDSPGAENTHEQAFDEAQNVLLTSNLLVDGGTIAQGTYVDSHMIFLNTAGGTLAMDRQTWSFYGDILGVMSDRHGDMEVASSSFLGAPGTIYPSLGFNARGMETTGTYADSYTFTGNQIGVIMNVTEPGDWIRVVTEHAAAPVPEPASMLLLGTGLVGLAGFTRKKSRG